MTKLTEDQLNRILKRPTQEPQPETFTYDPALDETVEGMFNRRWDRDEVFPSGAKETYFALNSRLFDYLTTLDQVRLLIALVEKTNSQELRSKAIDVLQCYLKNGSQNADCSLKPTVRLLIEKFESHE